MLKPDEKKARELASVTYAADLRNNSNFSSIGINQDQLEKFRGEETKAVEDKKAAEMAGKKDDKSEEKSAQSAEKDTEKTEKKSEKKAAQNFNTKDNLYSKVDLTRLRQQFIFSCQDALNPDLFSYGVKLQNECNAIVEKWEDAK